MKKASASSKKNKATATPPAISDAESDRRLRPVLDAYYTHNSRHALKLVNQALHKRPGWPAARALRACVHEQSGQHALAESEVDEVYAQVTSGNTPLAEDTVLKLHIYFSAVRREVKAAALYEMLWRTNVANIKHAETAFCLYVRATAFPEAQKLAMKLNKLFTSSTNKSPAASQAQVSQKFVFWATVALWLNVTYHARSASMTASDTIRAPPHAGDKMLKLGCAMMSKALHDSAITPTAEMVRFAVRVFKQAGDHKAAVQLLSNRRLVMDDVEVLHLRADVAFHSDKDPADYKALLTQRNSNDWGYWLRLFECLKKRSPDTWIAEAQAVVDGEISKVESPDETEPKTKEPPRGVYLANMELIHKRKDWSSLAAAIVKYFDKFGSKAVVTRDLKSWIVLLKDCTDIDNSGRSFESIVLSDLEKISETKGFPYHMHLCWLKLWCESLPDTPQQLVKRYLDERVAGLESTERQPGDDYLILATHQLLPLPPSETISSELENLDLNDAQTPVTSSSEPKSSADASVEQHRITLSDESIRYADPAAVFQAIALLEAGLKWSPCNHEMKLLLIRLYTVVGGVERVSSLWDSLDVKHVQASTLSHIVLRPFFNSGHHTPLQGVLKHIEVLWREIEHEIPDCVTRAFQEGSLNSAVDFVLFKLRLERSVVLVDAMVIDAMLNVVLTAGETLGLKAALDGLCNSPKFTPQDLDGSKRIISNQDTSCYRFWDRDSDHDPHHAPSSEPLSDEFIEQGTNCAPGHVETLRAELVSIIALIQLTLRNGAAKNADDVCPAQSLLNLVSPDAVHTMRHTHLSPDADLRLSIAKNLVNISSVLQALVGDDESRNNGATKHTNGSASEESSKTQDDGHDDELRANIDLVVKEATQLTARVRHLVQDAVGEGASGGSDTPKEVHEADFPRRLNDSCKVTFHLLLLVSVAVSSFSPVLTKGSRRARKASVSAKNPQSFPVQHFDRARSALLMYRDAVVAATQTIQQWVTAYIDQGVGWAGTVLDEALATRITALIPDDMCTEPLAEDAPAKQQVNSDAATIRARICADIVNSLKSSHSVSCSALLENLTTVTRRLQLSDL